MLPDSPTNVIISDKRLIGQHTMSFPLIKELSRKTEIATKHCQQSNQRPQLAVNSDSWAEHLWGAGPVVMSFQISTAAGVKDDKDGERAQSLLHTNGACINPLWRGERQGASLQKLLPGPLSAFGCLFVWRQCRDLMKNTAASFPSSWTSAGCSLGSFCVLNDLSYLEQFHPFFKIYKQLLPVSFM